MQGLREIVITCGDTRYLRGGRRRWSRREVKVREGRCEVSKKDERAHTGCGKWRRGEDRGRTEETGKADETNEGSAEGNVKERIRVKRKLKREKCSWQKEGKARGNRKRMESERKTRSENSNREKKNIEKDGKDKRERQRI